MISEKAVRAWIVETRESYADLALEYRERNMNGESYREFNEMAAAGCDSAVSALSLLLESFDQRLALGMFDAEEVPEDGESD